MIDIGINEKVVSPSDIFQNNIGNCYLMAALSTVAEDERIIFNNFITKERNKIGMFCVKYFINGNWRAVFLDENFPVKDL